jgi:hypothetical protein
MKRIWQLLICAVLWPALCGVAQDSLPRKDAATPTASASPTPTPVPQSALALIPPPLPSPAGSSNAASSAPVMPDLSQLNQLFKQTTPGKEAELYRAHVEWRKLKNRTVNDPAVVAAKAAAQAASTDLEKRNRLRRYYEVFYARMRVLASTPEMVSYLDSVKKTHLDLLAQPRVRPTPESEKKAEQTNGQPAQSTPEKPAQPTPEPSAQPIPEPSLPNE